MGGDSIRTRLRELIEEKGVTPYEVSKMTGISQATLSRILNNATTKLNIQNLTLLSEYFNVNYDWLSTGKGDRNRVHYGSYSGRDAVASDIIAAYRSDTSLIDSHNRLARAMETIAESNKVLAESNKRVTENNEKVMNEVLRVVRDLETKRTKEE